MGVVGEGGLLVVVDSVDIKLGSPSRHDARCWSGVMISLTHISTALLPLHAAFTYSLLCQAPTQPSVNEQAKSNWRM